MSEVVNFKDKPLDERKPLVRAMLERMARAYGINKRSMAKYLGCARSVVNNWVYYGRIPFEQLDACHRVTGVSLEWLLYGDDESNIIPEPASQDEIRSIVEKALNCGVELNLVTSNYDNSIEQLGRKISQDLHQQFIIKNR